MTVAAAYTNDQDQPTAKEDANGKEAPGGGGTYGVALSGSFAVNGVWDDTKAYIADSVITQSAGLEVKADQTTLIVAVSGAAALSRNQEGSYGIAGAVTVNIINNDTLAYVHNSNLVDVGVLTLKSESTGTIIGVAAGLSGSANGIGIAGSVSVNVILGDTYAYLDAGSDVDNATSVSIHAKDTSSIIAVAGAIAYGGKAGVGAGVAVNYVGTWSKAYVENSDITIGGTLDVKAENYPDIVSVAAAIGASTGARPMAGAISVSVNIVSADTSALIRGEKTANGIDATGGILISATDDSAIHVYAGGIALAWGYSSRKEDRGIGTSVTIGVAIAINRIDNDVEALIEDATVDSGGEVELTATSTSTIYSLTIGGSVSVATGEKAGFALAGAGAGSGNKTQNTVTAAIKNVNSVTTVTAAGGVSLTATDSSQIMADAGGFAIAVGYGGKDGGAALSVGFSIVDNDIENTTEAYVHDSTVTAGSSVELLAESTAAIEGWSIAGSVAAGVSNLNSGLAGAGAGAGTYNKVKNKIEAYVTGGSDVTATAGDVAITARDNRHLFTIDEQSGWIADLDNGDLPNDLRDAFETNDVTLSDNVTVMVRTEGEEWLIRTRGFRRDDTFLVRKGPAGLEVLRPTVINTDAGGFALAVSMGGSVAVGASWADNDIQNQVRAYIGYAEVPDSPQLVSVSAAGEILLSADSAAVIDALTIGVAVAGTGASSSKDPAFALSGAGAAAYNKITNTVEAFVRGEGTFTTSGGDLRLTATDSSGIIAKAYGGWQSR